MGFMDKVKDTTDKAKDQFDKNRHKVAPLVGKATDQVDKATKGKSRSVTKHVDAAAQKLSTTGSEPSADETGEAQAGPASDDA